MVSFAAGEAGADSEVDIEAEDVGVDEAASSTTVKSEQTTASADDREHARDEPAAARASSPKSISQ
jgi:hypothetical protein